MKKAFCCCHNKDNWLIEAQGHIKIKLLQSIPLENQPVAQMVIHYVVRAKENVVLDNATQEGHLRTILILIKQHPKSV